MKRSTITAALAAIALVVAGCGGAADEGGSGGGSPGKPAPVTGFDGKTIKLGVLTPLSGPVAVIGQPLTAGNKVWYDYINSQGGIAGKYKIELVVEDTQYKTNVTVQKYNKIKDQVLAFTQILGTPPTKAVLPLLEQDNIMAAPASLDAAWVREKNLLPVGGPYQIQAINALYHWLNEGGGSKDSVICTMIQDDVYGEAGQQGIEFAAKRFGVEVANTQRFKAGTTNYTGQIGALAQAGCEMVFLVATPSDAGTIWGTAAQAGFTPQWYAQSPSWVGALAQSEIAPYLQEHVLIVAEGTEWDDTSVPGMEQLITNVEKFKPNQKPDIYFAFGYNQGRAMTALLEKAVELGDLSREGLLEASRQLGTVSFGGLTGDYTYGPVEERNPPRKSTIFSVDPSTEFGLSTLKYMFSSKAAKAYTFG